MKKLLSLTALIALSACDVPLTAPDGAIPIAQLLAETEGRPYECVDYDATTDTCTTVSRFQPTDPNTYYVSSLMKIAEDFPVIEVSGTMRANARILCSDLSDVSVRSASNEEGFMLEATLAQIEDAYRATEMFCGSYIPSGDSYTFRVLSGPPEAFAEPNLRVRFFDTGKELRLPQ